MTNETHLALISGGHDSTVAAHVAMRWGPCEALLYLDTGTGAQRNREFIRRYADRYGWHLIEWRTPENYGELVKKYGFPGPSKHNWFYRYLKERQMQKLATITNAEVHLWTGVYRAESDERMSRVVEKQDGNGGRWVFRAPCAAWDPEDFARYHDRFGLPTNPLWRTLGRSGDCFCGAFGDRMELVDAAAAGCHDVVEQIDDLEAEIDRDDNRDRWAWGDDRAHVADAIRDDDQPTLCSHCTNG